MTTRSTTIWMTRFLMTLWPSSTVAGFFLVCVLATWEASVAGETCWLSITCCGLRGNTTMQTTVKLIKFLNGVWFLNNCVLRKSLNAVNNLKTLDLACFYSANVKQELRASGIWVFRVKRMFLKHVDGNFPAHCDVTRFLMTCFFQKQLLLEEGSWKHVFMGEQDLVRMCLKHLGTAKTRAALFLRQAAQSAFLLFGKANKPGQCCSATWQAECPN